MNFARTLPREDKKVLQVDVLIVGNGCAPDGVTQGFLGAVAEVFPTFVGNNRGQPNRTGLPLATVAANFYSADGPDLLGTFIGDTFAYGGGRLFGRRKLAPKLSPNKTQEGLIIGIIAVNLPFMVLSLQSVIEGIDRSVEEAAFSLGASPGIMFRRVLWPLAMPGILAGTILCFILAMNAYATPFLLGGPLFKMMAPLVYNQFTQQANWPFGGAIAFIRVFDGVLQHKAPIHLMFTDKDFEINEIGTLTMEKEPAEALAEEISQLLYWTQVLMISRGLSLDDVYEKL